MGKVHTKLNLKLELLFIHPKRRWRIGVISIRHSQLIIDKGSYLWPAISHYSLQFQFNYTILYL